MRDIVDELAEHNTTLVAITPNTTEHSQKLVEKHKLNFPMLSDPGNNYAAELGIRFTVPPEVKEIYQGFGIDMEGTNGDDSWTLPIPMRIVVDRDGTVKVADIDPDYTRRPEPSKTLNDVKSL